ncbi:MAG: lactate utilization protein [Actinomycetota bacterium]|nr:lactate utilization protein [Actinomycetota bacterium]
MSSFRSRARHALADPDLQQALRGASGGFTHGRERAWNELPDAQGLRRRAAWARRRAVATLPEQWERFTEAAEEAGAEMFWATTAGEAVDLVVGLATEVGARLVVKSKSMLSEEIHLNEALEGAGMEVVETDLGELIVQWAHEPPSHIIAPAVHKTRQQVRALFAGRTGTDPGPEIPALTELARRHLRGEFLRADVGISGANLAIAETGSVVLVTNEGNARMVATLPRMHIAVVGAEKVVADLDDAAVVLEMLARSATGQRSTSYLQWVTGPRRPGEMDGPERLCIVVVDAGRSRVAGTGYQDVLACIRCGSCLNVCPVYTTTGGHAYHSPYQGPIGAVITPLLRGGPGDWELAHASTLCGACLEACPVMIDLPQMLLDLRADAPRSPLARAAGRSGALLAAPRDFHRTFRGLRRLQGPVVLGGRLRWSPFPLGRWLRGRTLPPLASRFFRER